MRSKDVTAAIDYGADAVGFVLASPSSQRNLTLGMARKMMDVVPVFVTKVAVTSSTEIKTIQKICSTLRPDGLQLHQHTHKLVSMIRKAHPEIGLILATAIRDRSSILQVERSTKWADAVLADSPSSTGMGGTGRKHDWVITALLRRKISPHPLILAGGLTPGNVRIAVRKVKPFAVDVSTGVEHRIGVKDHNKIKEFIMNAKDVLG
jgi:phosphoribosylanthranilate isomerase